MLKLSQFAILLILPAVVWAAPQGPRNLRVLGTVVPCDAQAVGANQMVGCLWDGVGFTAPAGQAPAGPVLASPVGDNAFPLNLDWRQGGPNTQTGPDTFSARWKGRFTFKQGTYNFTVASDDGVRVKIDGATALDQWADQNAAFSFTRTFSAQTQALVEVEYFENGGDARLGLNWSLAGTPPAGKQFVTRSGSQLMLNGAPFRFSGINVPWLQMQEYASTASNGNGLPSYAEIDEAMNEIAGMKMTVIRTHGGISVPQLTRDSASNIEQCPTNMCIWTAPDTHTPVSMDRLDYAVKKAGEKNIRLVIALTDHEDWFQGGFRTFVRWAGYSCGYQDECNEFYYKSDVLTHYKRYITTIINYVNPYTGLRYGDDPTIMAWETGNELASGGNRESWGTLTNPSEEAWTRSIAQHIKSLAPRQLVVDGHYGVDPESISIPEVDIYSTHGYADYNSVDDFLAMATNACNGGKTIIYGEWDWHASWNTPDEILSAIEGKTCGMSGDMVWQYLPGNSGGDDYTIWVPGTNQQMTSIINKLTAHALRMCPEGAACRQ